MEVRVREFYDSLILTSRDGNCAVRQQSDHEIMRNIWNFAALFQSPKAPAASTVATVFGQCSSSRASLLYAGELGYFNVWGSQAKPKDTGISMAQALRTYVIANHLITGILNNRITEH